MRQSWDNLLEPTQFDWAEDVEDELEGDKGMERELDGVDETENEEADTVMEGKTDKALTSLTRYKITQTYTHMNADAHETEPYGPLIVNGAVGMTAGVGDWEQETDSDSNTEFDEEIESMQLAVNGEFAYRQTCLQADNDGFIHHFNWLGAPVYGHNPTPPAISLLFLLTSPKVPPSGHEWRYESIMKRAMAFVDPVFVYVDNGREDLLKRGFDLVRWATGRVYKFYSPHGKWVEDARDLEEFPVLDDGDLVNHASDNAVAGNGFVEQFSIKSRSQLATARDECFYMAHREQKKSRRKGFGSSSSPLRQSVTPSDFDEEDGKLHCGSCFYNDYLDLTCTETDHVEDIIVERPPSRLSRKRSFHENPSPRVGGLKRRASICDFKSELAGKNGESREVGGSRVDNFVRLSDEEKELAEDIKSRRLLKKTYRPVFATVGEEEEPAEPVEHTDGREQTQPWHNKYVSTGTQTELSGPVVGSSLTGSRNVEAKKQSLAYLSQKNKEWKKSFHSFATKARDILRPEKPRFTLASEPTSASQSSRSSTSTSTSAPGKEAGSSVSSSGVVASHADSGFSEPHASRHIQEKHRKTLSMKKKLGTKMSKVFRRSSSEHKSTPGKKSAFSEFCGNFFYDGIWALEQYPVYPLIL